MGVLFLLIPELFSCASSLRRYQLQQYHYYSPDVPEAFDQYRISLISDIHVWDPRFLKSENARARQARFDYQRLQEISCLLRSQRSHLLLLAGDYVSYRGLVRSDFSLAPYFRPLREHLRPRDGIVAVLGNHDHFLLPRSQRNLTIQALQSLDAPDGEVRILVNQQIIIPARSNFGTERLHILGIDDYMFGIREQQSKLLHGLHPDDFVLALTHNPDSFDLLQHPELIDMGLGGHLHGGQITLFGLALSVPARSKYLRQPFQGPEFPVFVSNGLGASHLQLRVMAPPQIWTIVLHHLSTDDIQNLKAYWRAERGRLVTAEAAASGRIVRPRHPQQDYRLIVLSNPARTYRHLQTAVGVRP